MWRGICHVCGDLYTSLGDHWSSDGGCSWPPIQREQYEICTGLLLGDGHIHNRDKAYDSTPLFSVSSTRPLFLQWIDKKLGWLSQTVSQVKPQRSSATGEHHAVYQLQTGVHPLFRQLGTWYRRGDLRFPTDIEMTPLVAKMWYCSDGGLHYCDGRATASIRCRNESHRGDVLEGYFDDVPVSPTYYESAERLAFNRTDTERFLEWMGKPPSGMRYKWTHNNRELYDCLIDYHAAYDPAATSLQEFTPADVNPYHNSESDHFPFRPNDQMPLLYKG